MAKLKAAICSGFMLAAGAAWAQAPDAGTPAEDAAVAAAESAGEDAADGLRPCPPLVDEAGEPVLGEDGEPQFDESPLPVLDEAGEPVLGEDGEPLTEACALPGTGEARPACPPLLDEAGEPVLGEDGEPQFDESPLPVLDEAGEPVLGEDGEPLTEACAVPGAGDGAPEETVAAEPEAEEAQSAASPIIRLLQAGGPVIVILAIMAVLALGVALVKVGQFLWLGVGRSGFVRRSVDTIRSGDERGALDALDERRNPVARVMAAALRGKLNPRMNDELVREETTRVAQAQLDGLERGLALLSLVATIAPLLGLLGTVLGMIEAFQQMETVGDRVEPAVLAGGIWEALLTTAAGLAVAIPAAVFFTWLQRAVDVEGQRMEDAATQVFTVPLYDGAGGEGSAAHRPPANGRPSASPAATAPQA